MAIFILFLSAGVLFEDAFSLWVALKSKHVLDFAIKLLMKLLREKRKRHEKHDFRKFFLLSSF